MEKQELIEDTGLFIGQKVFEFSLTDSFEAITNLFQTIKEYREYANPDNAAWFEYVHDIFHIFGFNTVKVAPRLISLQEMGANQTPKALVCIIGPREDFNQIVFGLDWESYLFYAAKFHQVEWVILTNGLQFKVLNYGKDADQKKYFKCEFDEIVKTGKADSFFTLYKIFQVIDGRGRIGVAGKTSKQNGKMDQKSVPERFLLREEFWKQMLPKSKERTKIFANKKPCYDHWISAGAGKSGLSYNYIVALDNTRIDFYIDNGHADWNKRTFDFFFENKSKIEQSIGHPLIWDKLEDKRASCIRYSFDAGGLKDKEKWPKLQDLMIDAMVKFDKAFRPFIQKVG